MKRQSFRGHHRRAAAITIELIAVVPILLIATIAILQLGAVVGAANQVALASRNGALAAAKVLGTSTVAANATLSTAGISTTGVTVTETSTSTSVQVSVQVPLQNTCPDLLKTFGFTLVGKKVTVTTVMPLNP